jgi:tetratricopeptide (TPR) repeat protein
MLKLCRPNTQASPKRGPGERCTCQPQCCTGASACLLYRDIGHRHGRGNALVNLGTVQRLTGDYQAAAASQRQALKLFRDLGDRNDQAYALNELGVLQRLTGHYRAAAASHRQALDLFREISARLGQAEALNNLGELLSQTPDSQQPVSTMPRPLAIARDLGVSHEEARALEGIGHCHIRDGNPGQAATHLRQALAIYQRIGAPGARRVQKAFQNHRLTSTNPESQSAAPDSEGHQALTPTSPRKLLDRRRSRDTHPARGAELPDPRGTSRQAPSNCERA